MDRKSQIIKLLQDSPEDVFLRYALAMEYMSLGQSEEAINALESLKASHPDYLPIYYQLAKLFETVNRTDEAIQTYEKGMEIAEQSKDRKTFGELRSALEELTF